jgi:ribonucleoside-diphosphate reductase alpha chain
MKSSGTSESFDLKKLEYAIVQSLGDGENNDELRQILLDTVLERIKEKTTTSTHYINDIIETYLLRNKHYDVLQKYIDNRFEKNKVYSDKVNLLGTRLVTDPDYDRGELSDFSVNQIQIAANRYLQRDMETGDIIESMTGWFDRVASHVVLGSVVYDPSVYVLNSEETKSLNHENMDKIENHDYGLSETQVDVLYMVWKKLNYEGRMKMYPHQFLEQISFLFGTDKYQSLYRKYFQYMYQGIFEPNTPTLMNAGTTNGKCSACFTLGVEDNMHSIMGLNSDSAYIFQGAGGLGTNISYIRPRGANIGTTFGAATGPIELVLEIIDFITQKVKSGGKRRGANMGLMEYWHPDIMEFINMKKTPGYLENFNISVMFDEDFWKHYHVGTDYDLKFNNKVYGKMSARNLIENIAVSAWSSAEPGVAFKDNANKANPLRTIKGDINICNPCLTGDIRLATDKGMIRMDELYLSGKQLQIPTDNRTINGNPEEKGITLRSAVPVFKTSDSADVWEVETEHGYSVKATDYHKFFVNRNGDVKMIELKDLKIGDKLLIQSDEGYFGNEGSEELGAVLGWYQADGQHTKVMDWKKENEKKKVVLDFYHEKKEVGKKFLGFVNNILPKTKSKNGLQDISLTEVSRHNLCSITSTRLGDLLDSLQVQKYEIPEIIWQGSRQCVVGYLQALFTADGTVFGSLSHHDYSIRLSSINKEFIKQVQVLLGNFGIFSKIRLANKSGYKLMPDGKGGKKSYLRQNCFELILVGDSRNIFIQEIGFLLQSKQNKAIHFSSKIKSKRPVKRETKIESINYVGKESVYDTTEYQTHTIIVSNIVTSQCAEQFMYDGESCTLGSINLAKLVREDGTFDWDGYVQIIHETTRFLNDVLEINQYPTEHIAEESDKSKRIGLGIMGLADLFFLLKIPYNSEYGFVMMEELSKTLYIESVKASIDLAEERGSCYWCKELIKGDVDPLDAVIRNYNDLNEIQIALGTEYLEKLEKFGIRNMWTTTIAPTGTISMIADCSSGLEPIFSLVFSKITTAGKYYYTSELFKKALIDAGIYSQQLLEKVEKNYGSCQNIDEIPKEIQQVFLTAMDLHWMDHVVAQSVWQNWIDNSISKTVNMPYNVTVEDVKNAYILAHELGLKGIALFRDGSRNEQVLHVGSNVQSNKNEQNVQKDVPGTQTIVQAPTKNQVERKIPPSPFGMNYIRDRVPEKLMVDLTLHAGKVVKYLEQGSECPTCKEMTLINEGGCSSCRRCGYASCSVA